VLISLSICCVTVMLLIDNYYSQITMSIINSRQKTIPYKDKGVSGSNNVVAGWN